MIESCNKRRLLIGFALLGGLTLIVLIVESHWTSSNSTPIPANTSEECWHKEKHKVLELCHPCTEFEINSKSVAVCVDTKYKEVIECEISGKVQRSCEKVTWIEERHYWIFEGIMFAVAVLSSAVVYYRQKTLDRLVKNRIQRQLASGLAN